MSAPISTEILLVKAETSYGVDPLPDNTDAVRVVAGSVNFSVAEGLRMADRKFADGTLGARQPVYGGRLPSIEFQVELKRGSAVDTPPEFGPLLRACGLRETINSGNSVDYTPRSHDHESCTIYYFEKGSVRHILTGCRGNVSVTATPGQPILATFSMRGFPSDPADSELSGSPQYDASLPSVFAGPGSCTIDGYEPRVSDVTFDLGNTLAIPPDANHASSYAPIRIASRKPIVNVEPELVDIGTRNWIEDMMTGQPVSGDVIVAGASTPGLVRVTASQGHIANVGSAEREGVRTAPLQIGLHQNMVDDEFVITLGSAIVVTVGATFVAVADLFSTTRKPSIHDGGSFVLPSGTASAVVTGWAVTLQPLTTGAGNVRVALYDITDGFVEGGNRPLVAEALIGYDGPVGVDITATATTSIDISAFVGRRLGVAVVDVDKNVLVHAQANAAQSANHNVNVTGAAPDPLVMQSVLVTGVQHAVSADIAIS